MVPVDPRIALNSSGYARYNERSNRRDGEKPILADEKTDEKVYKAEYLGSGTFLISKPKRKRHKARQTRLHNPERGSRK
jgi:hypothetical protein